LNYRAALVAWSNIEPNRDPKKRRRPFTPQDFMPRLRPDVPPSPETVKDKARLWNALLGGTEVKRNDSNL